MTSGGYVGLSIATLLSQHHKVTAVDIIPEKVDMINNRNQNKIKGFVVSDSVVLYSDNSDCKTLSELMDLIIELCREEFNQNSILIRGAIAKGNFARIPAEELHNLKKQLIVGDAYVEAYGMEDSFKSTGIRLSDEVHQDIINAGLNRDIVEETVDNGKYYILRYLSIDYLLETEGVFKEFIQAAKKSGWMRPTAAACDMRDLVISGIAIGMVATGILLNRLFGFRFIFLLCLVKQTKLLFCRFRLLTGWGKLLFAQQSEQLVHIPNLIREQPDCFLELCDVSILFCTVGGL